MLFTPSLEACLLKICTFHYYKVRAPEHILVTHQSSNFCHQTLWKTIASSPSHFRKGKSQGFTSKCRFQSTVNPHHLWIPCLWICLHATIDLWPQICRPAWTHAEQQRICHPRCTFPAEVEQGNDLLPCFGSCCKHGSLLRAVSWHAFHIFVLFDGGSIVYNGPEHGAEVPPPKHRDAVRWVSLSSSHNALGRQLSVSESTTYTKEGVFKQKHR